MKLTGGLMPHIPAIWAFLSVDPDGDEAVCGFQTANGWMAMVAADETRVTQLKTIAQDLATATGFAVRLVRFTTREDLEVILP